VIAGVRAVHRRRFSLLVAVALLLVCCTILAGCGESKETTAGDGSTTSTPSAVSGRSAEGLEPIPIDGPGETAAKDALPQALDAAEQNRATAGQAWPDLTGAEPVLEAYLLRVTMGGEVALLEVRADGTPHNLYAYQKAFDAGSLVWVPEENVTSTFGSARSDREKDAVAAVEEVIADAFPDENAEVVIHGYRFVYVKNEMILLAIEVDLEGALISVGS